MFLNYKRKKTYFKEYLDGATTEVSKMKVVFSRCFTLLLKCFEQRIGYYAKAFLPIVTDALIARTVDGLNLVD